jgi:hypothetical protein
MATAPTVRPTCRRAARVTGGWAGVLAIGVVVAACSSTPTSSTSTSTTTTRPAVTTTTATVATTTTTVAGATTTVTSGTVACATNQLVPTVVGGDGAAGTIESTVALRNMSTGSCVLGGYPVLQMVDGAGANLPTTTVDGGHYPMTSQPQTMVTVAPGSSASFNIVYSDVPTGNETTCPTSASIKITSATTFDPWTAHASLTPCNAGTLVVSPFLSGGTGGQ